MKLIFIVPVFNEAPNIPALVSGFREMGRRLSDRFELKFILVDDGSTDGTAIAARNLLQGLDFEILSHSRNGGPGLAFGTAFEWLSRNALQETDWVVTLEGDNTSRQEILDQMIQRTSEGYEVILASPYMYGGGIQHTTPLRVLFSHMANLFVKEFLGIHGILTMSSFYRLHRGRVLLRLQRIYGPRIISRSGFESMIEMVIKMIFIGAKISEVPMVLDSSRRLGKSKMKILKTVLGYIGIWFEKRRWVVQDPGC